MIVITACSIAERVWIPRRPDAHRVRTRMGNGAGVSLDRFLSKIDPPQAIISTGFCGGLSPDIRTGTTVVATKIIRHGEEIFVDPQIIAHVLCALDSAEIPYVVGTIVTTAGVAKSEVEKAALADTGAVAVDMESAVLARIADRYDIPFLPLRVVLDQQQTLLPFDISLTVAGQVLAHPIAALRVLRLAIVAGRVIGRAIAAIADSLTPRSERCAAK